MSSTGVRDFAGHGRPSHFVFYEELVADARGEYERLAAFLRVDVPADALAAIVRATTPEAMRAAERAHALPGANRRGDRAKVRTAKAQGFRDEVDNATIVVATKKMRPLLHPDLRGKWLGEEAVG